MNLLEPGFLARLASLRVYARRRFAGVAAGMRRSTRRGSSAELADHRAYYPGDDVRRIDWNAYARLDELVLKLFVAEDDLSLYLLVDTSASLVDRKLETAKKIAAGLGYVALSGSDRVSVWPFHAQLEHAMPPSRGKKRVATLLRVLDGLESHGGTNLDAAIDAFLARRLKPGLVAIISDFLDPNGFARPIDRLLSARHEPVLFHVVDRAELEPEIGGDLLLVDAERETEIEVTLDERTVRAYRARVARYFEEIESYAKKRGFFYGRVESAEAFEDVLLTYLRGS